MLYPILSLAILGLAYCDPIQIHVDITCEKFNGDLLGSKWFGKLTIYEEDTYPDHDILHEDEFLVINGNRKKTMDYETWPGGDLTLHYEFMYHFTHNCTSDGQLRCIIPSEPQDVRFWGERWITFNISAYDNGVRGECYDPNMNEEDTRKMKAMWN